MKNILAAIMLIALLLSNAVVFAADNPTCVLMKFTDDTRYDLVESANSLSDLVMEKMIAGNKFRLMETRPLEENIDIQLYNEKMRDLQYLEEAIVTGDFNQLFEGVGFDEKKAQSIASAQVGQIIDPEITSAIGKNHNAEYLIQGTIINLGTGSWWSDNFEVLSGALNLASALMTSSIPLGSFGDIIGGFNVNKIGIGVQCDMRIIKAETGEVVWNRRFVGVEEEASVSLSVVTIGNRKLNNDIYTKSMDKVAKKIVDAMAEEL